MHGTPQPSWECNVLDRHCILYLPDEQRVIDATIEQFRKIARLKHGPLVGRMAVQLTQAARQRRQTPCEHSAPDPPGPT